MIKKYIFFSFGLIAFLQSATLEVYQDQTIYKLNSKNKFIGFTSGIKTTCNDEDINLEYRQECKSFATACKLYNKLKDYRVELNKIDINLKTIDALINTKERELNANKLIENASIITQKKSDLTIKKENIINEIKIKSNKFNTITTHKEPLFLENECNGEIKVIIPYSYINFKPIYEADIKNDKIKVIQKLEVTNKSGIDINAKEAIFYYRLSKEYINPINFTPWIAKEFKPILYKKKTKALSMRTKELESIPSAEVVEPAVAEIPETVGKYNDSREYSITNLTLPTTNRSKKVKILEYESKVKCLLIAYPYTSKTAFNVCSFKPKYQIDNNNWIVKENGSLINKKAIGRYENGMYKIYKNIDRDIKIVRKKIVSKERESGIFGGTRKQKDGYIIVVTNKSNKKKNLKIIDRIPTSNTDKIEVKLLSIQPKIDYKLNNNGKIEMNLNLKAKENVAIKVIFELTYDKDLRIRY